jgi:hypothetical protein
VLRAPEDGPKACGGFFASLRTDREFRTLLRTQGAGVAFEYDVGWAPLGERFVLVDSEHFWTGLVVCRTDANNFRLDVPAAMPADLRGLVPD